LNAVHRGSRCPRGEPDRPVPRARPRSRVAHPSRYLYPLLFFPGVAGGEIAPADPPLHAFPWARPDGAGWPRASAPGAAPVRRRSSTVGCGRSADTRKRAGDRRHMRRVDGKFRREVRTRWTPAALSRDKARRRGRIRHPRHPGASELPLRGPAFRAPRRNPVIRPRGEGGSARSLRSLGFRPHPGGGLVMLR
jgi:hypothetical protein